MACCIPDVDIPVIYGRTGRPGTLSLEKLIQDISCVIDSTIVGADLPIEAGHNIEFTTNPANNFIVINTIDDPQFLVSVTSPDFIYMPIVVPTTSMIGSTFYDGGLGSTTAGHFVGNNGQTSESGKGVVILDFNPQDILPGTGITVDRTDTTATIGLGVQPFINFTNGLLPGTITTLSTNPAGQLQEAVGGGAPQVLATLADIPVIPPDILTTSIVLPGVNTLGANFKEETYRILVTATATVTLGFGLLPTIAGVTFAYTAASVEGGIGVNLPALVVATPPTFGVAAIPGLGDIVAAGVTNPLGLNINLLGSTLAVQTTPFLVTLIFPPGFQFVAGYNTQLTPIRLSGAPPYPYASPMLSVVESLSNNTQLTFSVDSVTQLGLLTTPGLLPVGIQPLLGDLLTVLAPDPVLGLNLTLSYQFGVEVTVTGA